MYLGERIKNILKEKGLTQKQLSIATKIPPSSIVDIIKSRVEPSVYKVQAIANYLNVDLAWLITGVEYRPELQENAEQWRISDGAKHGYNATRSAMHVRVIMNACAMDKEQFAQALGIPVTLLELYLKKGIPESDIVYKMIKLGREHGEPVDLEWFVTGLGKK